MGANIAGIYGAQIFREDDRPRYRRAFSVNIAVLAVGLAMVVFRFVDDRLRRRWAARKAQAEPSSEHAWQDEEKVPVVPPSDVVPQTVLLENGLKQVVVADPAK